METSAKGRGLYINPLTDLGLKKVFGDGEVMRAFLNDLPERARLRAGAPSGSCATKSDEWLYNIANMSTMDTREIPFSDRQPAMKRMFGIAEVADMTPAEAGSYDIGFGSWLSSRDSCDTAQRKGMEKGVEYGLAKGKAEAQTGVITRMPRHGVGADEIEKTTGIAREVIEEVKRKTTR